MCGSQHSTQCLEQVPSFISAFPKHLNPLGQGEGSCSLPPRLQNSWPATSTPGDVLHPWDSPHGGGQSLRTSGPWLDEDKQGDPPGPPHLLRPTYSAQVLGEGKGTRLLEKECRWRGTQGHVSRALMRSPLCSPRGPPPWMAPRESEPSCTTAEGRGGGCGCRPTFPAPDI